jgi:hypothetical protein
MVTSLSMLAVQFTTTNLVLWGTGAVLFCIIVARRRARNARAK